MPQCVYNSSMGDRAVLCGLGGWRPRPLQSLATPTLVVTLMIAIRWESSRTEKLFPQSAALYTALLNRMTNKLTDKYLSSTLSTTERYFGLKTKEMSLVLYI